MTVSRFRLPPHPTEPIILEIETHRAGDAILDAGGTIIITLADGSTLTAELARRPRIDNVPVGGHRRIGPRPTLELKPGPDPTDTTA